MNGHRIKKKKKEATRIDKGSDSFLGDSLDFRLVDRDSERKNESDCLKIVDSNVLARKRGR